MKAGKKTRFLFVVIGFVLLVFSHEVPAQTVKVPQTDTAPVVDGDLNDPVWRYAAVFTDFKTMKPDYGLPPSEETVFYMTYDLENIYLGFRCYDREAEKIKATFASRDNDAIGNDDWVAFCLDPFNDELGAYFFLVNPFGVQVDGTLNADADPDMTLDMVWNSAGKMNGEGYAAEIAIPFKSLRFPSKDVNVMGFKVARNISRRSEEVDFPEYHPERGAALAQFQKIELAGIQERRLVEVLPATTVSQNGFRKQGDMVTAGTDEDVSITSKIGLTSGLVFDVTYNPDFSQVETDAGQVDVNLRYSLFYPEKRSFFLEGQERFAFGASPEDTPLGAVIHTRTIVDPGLGLKLTGKMGDKNIISAIYAQDEYAGERAADDGDVSLAHRKTHFSVLRHVRRLQRDSYIGGFYTGRSFAGDRNHVAGADGRLRLNNHSFLEYHAFGSSTKNRENNKNHKGTALGATYVYNTRRFHMNFGINEVSRDFHTAVGYLTRRGVTVIPVYAQVNINLHSGWLQKIEPYYWARHTRDKVSGLYESFNVLSVRFRMPRQSTVHISTFLANEVFNDRRFSRNAIRIEAESQIAKQLFLETSVRKGKYVFYDDKTPYQGSGTQTYFSLLFQPVGYISSGVDVSYTDFYRDSDDKKVFDYTIFRNRTTLQLNKYLFLREVVEYNTFRKRLNADFLLSFTYIPGTVVYTGYGSLYEKVRWLDSAYLPAEDYLLTRRSFFFKASYLWRF